MLGIDIGTLLKDSFAMWLLLITSVVAVAYILERIWASVKWVRDKKKVNVWLESVSARLQNGSTNEVLAESRRQKHPSALLVGMAVENAGLAEEDLNKVLNAGVVKLQSKLEKNLGILGTISSIAPLLGLFGTVSGIIRSFRDMAISGSGGASIVAMGVAVALVTTAVGILIAVPALIAYNYFAGFAGDETSWIESLRDDIIIWMKNSKRKK